MRILNVIVFFFFIGFIVTCSHGISKKSSEFIYTKNWTTPHAPHWEKVTGHLKGKPDIQFLEVGVFEGQSLIWMFKNILTHPSSKAVVIDPFVDNTQDAYYSNIELAGISNRVTTITGYSQKTLRDLPLNHFDIMYIDGSHYSWDVLSDVIQGWELMKVGGIIIFDDYLIEVMSKDEGPRLAIDSFLSIYKDKLEVLHKDYQVSIRKIKE